LRALERFALAIDLLLLGLTPGLGLGELGALDVEHALQLGEIAPERVELCRELLRSGIELAHFDVAGLKLEEVNQLIAQGTTFRFRLLQFSGRGPTWAR